MPTFLVVLLVIAVLCNIALGVYLLWALRSVRQREEIAVVVQQAYEQERVNLQTRAQQLERRKVVRRAVDRQ